MKNLLIYINPVNKKFSPEHEILTKIQIDNSLNFGWQKKDILLVTNFAYEYQGVSSIVVSHYEVFDQNRSTKIPAILELWTKNLIKDDIYWFHDHDAFQIAPLSLDLKRDAAFTTHGAYSKTWNAGSFFFKQTAQDMFELIWQSMNERGTNEQNALTYLWENNINNINKRYQLLDPSYNLGIYKIPENVKNSIPPIKIVHFHPHKQHHLQLFKDMLPEGLVNIFKKYALC